MTQTIENLLSSLESKGFRGSITPIRHIQELRDEIETRRQKEGFDPNLEREYLSSFVFSPPAELPDAQSLLIVATPSPQIEITFHGKGKPFHLRIPPTYIHDTDAVVEKGIREILGRTGHGLARARVPEKLLAVRNGLAEYGRNNIAYVPGMGSFYRLIAFYTDLPCNNDSWREEKILDRCANCNACQTACPTGAIRDDRFLVQADRCLTFLNERPGDFPEWIDPSWHHCIVGCMRCQEICPENRRVKEWVEQKGSFTEEETEWLLAGKAAEDNLPEATRKKLEDLDITEYKNLLQRNLGVLLNI